jgi:hypothetical protein
VAVLDTTPPRVIEDELGASPLQSAITDIRPRGNRVEEQPYRGGSVKLMIEVAAG